MKVRVCPNCRSLNIHYTVTTEGVRYRCGNCGYEGENIVEEEIEKH